jgi:hypothetical protein
MLIRWRCLVPVPHGFEQSDQGFHSPIWHSDATDAERIAMVMMEERIDVNVIWRNNQQSGTFSRGDTASG